MSSPDSGQATLSHPSTGDAIRLSAPKSTRAAVNFGPMPALFSLIESPFHPSFSDVHPESGMEAPRFDSARNLQRTMQAALPEPDLNPCRLNFTARHKQ